MRVERILDARRGWENLAKAYWVFPSAPAVVWWGSVCVLRWRHTYARRLEGGHFWSLSKLLSWFRFLQVVVQFLLNIWYSIDAEKQVGQFVLVFLWLSKGFCVVSLVSRGFKIAFLTLSLSLGQWCAMLPGVVDPVHLSMNQVLKHLKREENSLYNCLNSIIHDSVFVRQTAELYPSLPVFANLRCGLWYISQPQHTCYFKSTDGHYGNWSFSMVRLNWHVALSAAENGGAIIVDATRRGKVFPVRLKRSQSLLSSLILNYFQYLTDAYHLLLCVW